MPHIILGFVVSLCLLLAPAAAYAQSSSRWGVAGSVTPEVRAAGGLNLPGYNVFSVTAVYLFGAK